MAMERTDGAKMPAENIIGCSAKVSTKFNLIDLIKAGTYFRLANSPNSYVSLVKKVAK